MSTYNYLAKNCLGAAFLSMLMCLPTGGRAEPFGLPKSRDANQITASRDAGKRGDQQSVPELIAVLKQVPQVHTDAVLTAVHSLAQLGAAEALPDIDTIAATEKDVSVLNYIKVAEARLFAERTLGSSPSDPAKTAMKLRVFCQNLNLSAARLNTVAASYKASQGPWQHPPVPVEVYALREVADILYDNHFSDYKRLPIIGALDFSADYPSALKINLINLSRTARIDWIINDLANKKALTPEDDYDLQLARDEGGDAAQAAVTKLIAMDRNRARYAAAGFDALIGVVDGTDKALRRIIRERFRGDSDPVIASAAQIGGPGGGAAGY